MPAAAASAIIEQVYACQPTLLGGSAPTVDPAFHHRARTLLDHRSWVDHVPGWLTGDQVVFEHLVRTLPWRQRTGVVMYDRLVDEPRRSAWWTAGDGPEPHPVLASARRLLGDRYGREFESIGCNWYRDGRDSVAWHGDRHRRHELDPLVAIVSLGSPRSFRIRPRGGGPSMGWDLGHGDLLVMGGACQHDWEHTVTKTARRVGPRISVTFRHGARTPDHPSTRPTPDAKRPRSVRDRPGPRVGDTGLDPMTSTV